jgi:hypothetical protein
MLLKAYRKILVSCGLAQNFEILSLVMAKVEKSISQLPIMPGSFSLTQLPLKSGIMSFSLLLTLSYQTLSLFYCCNWDICCDIEAEMKTS